MKPSLSRRIEHLARVVAPCSACDERARQAEESAAKLASLAEQMRTAVLAQDQVKDGAAWGSEAAQLYAEAAKLRQRAVMLEATDWEAAMAKEREKRAEAKRRLYRDDCLRCAVARDDRGTSSQVRSLATRLTQYALEQEWDPSRLEDEAERLEEQAAQAAQNAATAEGSKTKG